MQNFKMTNHHYDRVANSYKKLPNNSKNLYWCSRSFRKYKCWKCNFKTDFLAALKTHYKDDHQYQREHIMQLYVCNDCGLQTLSKLLFLLHKKSKKCATKNHTSVEENTIYFQCDHCSFKTETKTLLAQHNLEQHFFVEEVKLFNCTYKTKREHLLRNEQPQKSNDCTIKEHTQLQQLMEDNIKYLKCEHCTFKTETKTLLDQDNLEQHSSAEEVTSFNCEIFTYKTKREDMLKRHLTTNHAGESDKLQCGRCGSQFTPKDNFTQINKRDYGEKNQQFTCEQCILKTKLKDMVEHLGNNEILSQQFSSTNKQKRDLKQHLALKHSKEVNSQCEYCFFTFKRKCHLKRHLVEIHLKDMIHWFNCEECSYKSKRKDRLKRHIMVRHKKADEIDWLYCKNCPYKAKRKDNLKQHIIVRHTNVDEIQWFYCKHCSSKHKQKELLRQHAINKHREDYMLK